MNRTQTGLITLAGLALSPFVPVLLGGIGATVLGCEVRSMDAAPCFLGRWDSGPVLTNLFFCLWFLLVTVPLATVILIVWGVVWAIRIRKAP
ncbi:hypothetical protein [Deinococcus arenicola]|uniref:Uncharacterized protein n=1 Tax=Deinococcus arenicola TaxID=2994950 RepID=A0ABU4DNE4_9DEIO|nr:hypothetical protein [Deinococcus sp. ZS9-10]MDV6373873.1 hypothetical protein [Deinococcus sp. ZS9-10]